MFNSHLAKCLQVKTSDAAPVFMNKLKVFRIRAEKKQPTPTHIRRCSSTNNFIERHSYGKNEVDEGT